MESIYKTNLKGYGSYLGYNNAMYGLCHKIHHLDTSTFKGSQKIKILSRRCMMKLFTCKCPANLFLNALCSLVGQKFCLQNSHYVNIMHFHQVLNLILLEETVQSPNIPKADLHDNEARKIPFFLSLAAITFLCSSSFPFNFSLLDALDVVSCELEEQPIPTLVN